MSLDRFEPLSVMHLVVVVVLAFATWAVVRGSRGLSRRSLDRRRFWIGLVALGVFLANQVYWMGFRSGSGESLPLHLCDVAGLIAALAFLIPTRALRALLYYWGLGLSTLAFVIPVTRAGPNSPEFWLFWISHWAIVGGAIYLVTADGFRPAWRDLWFATAAMVVCGFLTMLLNIAWGTNYMYTGDHPMPTPGELELAWPVPRVPILGVAAFALMLAAHLPWAMRKGGTR